MKSPLLWPHFKAYTDKSKSLHFWKFKFGMENTHINLREARTLITFACGQSPGKGGVSPQ